MSLTWHASSVVNSATSVAHRAEELIMRPTTPVVPYSRPSASSPLLTRRTLLTLAAVTAVASRVGRAAAAQDATPTTQSATVHINGIDLYYEERGSGPPLLIIPPLSSTGFTITALEPHFRIITFDNRGAGRSSVPPGPYTTRLMADDAAALLEHLGVERAHVFGFSLGAEIAQELALAYPERVDRLVLNGAFARPRAGCRGVVRDAMLCG